MIRSALQGQDGLARMIETLMGAGAAPALARSMAAENLQRRLLEYHALVEDLNLRALARHLPCTAPQRIAAAPLFAGLVRMHEDTTMAGELAPSEAERALLAGWIMAELALVGEHAPDAPLWTALGDAAFAPDTSPRHAPTLYGVVIDTASPYVTEAPFLPPHMRVRSRAATDPVAALAALRDAVALLAETHQPSGDFATISLASFALYDTPGNARSFSSSSSRTFPGAAALSNVAGPGMDRWRLADSVLHEAVHTFLYAVEGAIPFFRQGPRHEPTIRSPWTGVALPLHAFVHACFVWLTLLAFWRRAEAQDEPGPAADYASRAASGFSGTALEKALADAEPRLTPEATAALHVAYAHARDLA